MIKVSIAAKKVGCNPTTIRKWIIANKVIGEKRKGLYFVDLDSVESYYSAQYVLDDKEGEIWKDLKGYDYAYQISSHGRLKTPNWRNTGKVNILKPAKDKKGYLRTAIIKNGKLSTVKMHRLVCDAFHENPNNKPFVNHIDSDKSNNHYTNLEWCTPKENVKHSIEHGNFHSDKVKASRKRMTANRKAGINVHYGSKVGTSILNEEKVLKIRTLWNEGFKDKRKLGEMFGVAKATIKDVVLGRSWKHVIIN